jgi:hypothetical protein
MVKPRQSNKPIKLLIILTLACIVCVPIISPLQAVAAQSANQTQYYNRQFAWEYNGSHWTWNLSIPASLYAAYKVVPQSVRTQFGAQDFGFFTTTQDFYIQTLAQKLNESATQRGYGSYDAVNFALAFVQSIPYKTDNESTGYQSYPRFPVETLVDNVGDCKSHSVLFATLTLMMDYGTVYINPPDHLAVGILGNNLKGTYWTYNEKNYYYCETTASGYTIGQLPDQFSGQTANIYGIDLSRQYIPVSGGITSIDPEPTISQATPIPTINPTDEPTQTSSPSIPDPTVQPALPMSINLISEAPILFAIIVVAVAICIIVAIKSARPAKEEAPMAEAVSLEPRVLEDEDSTADSNKFCIYCGSSNKSYAVYCEKCGKQIG